MSDEGMDVCGDFIKKDDFLILLDLPETPFVTGALNTMGGGATAEFFEFFASVRFDNICFYLTKILVVTSFLRLTTQEQICS